RSFIYIMQVSGNITTRVTNKTGDVLTWNMGGTIYEQNSLPSHSFSGTNYVSVVSTDGWDGITNFRLNQNNFSGACPNFNFTNVLIFRIDDNNFSGTCPLFVLPNLTVFQIQDNNFSGYLPELYFPNATFFLVYNNQFSGTFPNISLNN